MGFLDKAKAAAEQAASKAKETAASCRRSGSSARPTTSSAARRSSWSRRRGVVDGARSARRADPHAEGAARGRRRANLKSTARSEPRLHAPEEPLLWIPRSSDSAVPPPTGGGSTGRGRLVSAQFATHAARRTKRQERETTRCGGIVKGLAACVRAHCGEPADGAHGRSARSAPSRHSFCACRWRRARVLLGALALDNRAPEPRRLAPAHPQQMFDVIIQSAGGADSADVARTVRGTVRSRVVKRQYRALRTVSASVSGAGLLRLAGERGMDAITRPVSWRRSGADRSGRRRTGSAAGPVPPASMTFSWVRTRSRRVCSGPDDLAGPREAPTCCLRGGPPRGRLQPGRPVAHDAAGIGGGRPVERGGPVRECLARPVQLARLSGEPRPMERLRERIPVCAGPCPARLRGAHEGHPQRRDDPAARDRQGDPDRVAVHQSGWARRIGRGLRPRRGHQSLPACASQALRHRRVRSARGEFEHGHPVHRQPRRAGRAGPLARRCGRARGARRVRPRRTPANAPSGTTPRCRTCRPMRSRATSTPCAWRSGMTS